MMRSIAVLFLTLNLAAPAHATELFETKGTWVGKGVLPVGVEAPLQPGKCSINIAPEPNGNDVSVTGHCFIEMLFVTTDISIRIVRSSGGQMRAGFWVSALGQTVQLAGVESSNAIHLGSKTHLMLAEKPYESNIRLSNPDADRFEIRVLLRDEGAEAWRKFAEISFRRSGG